ncbi:RHS repeat-associated core domain-containing protein [Pseudomonas sp. Q12-87]|uniref:RHS repeat-associated core domain-containing protein n=1 Tax=Pseudomonas sp. Q12-87 TaxID=177989 RepID=UPI000AA64E50|nr:RHS repeat-associated core domain-containing protein [Pseudomonas sp. Q12-87]
MPTAPRETVLCRYRYDPLDRLTDCAPGAEARTQRFYCKSRLATEIQGAVQHSVFQHDDQLLAQLRREDARVEPTLLATDQQRSVLNALDATRPHPLTYTPYGHRPAENGLLSLLGFNGERPDPVTRHYLLGNGYRAFNPVLMRFNSPDSLSPFGEGGLNAYAYCAGDPRNWIDPSGHFWGIGKRFRSLLNITPTVPRSKTPIKTPTRTQHVKTSGSDPLYSALDEAQFNTTTNRKLTIPADERPFELIKISDDLELLRQQRMDVLLSPNDFRAPQQAAWERKARRVANSSITKSLRKEYSNVMRRFHNSVQPAPISQPRKPQVHKPQVRFSGFDEIKEFTNDVRQPA